MGGKLHAWRIEDREYARQEERRGRRHAFEVLEPARTALVVIDMVRFFVSDSSYCLGIVPNISSIAAALRAAGGTVAWVVPAAADRMVVSEEFFGPQTAAVFRRSGGGGPVAGRLWEDFEVHPDDLLAEKTSFSAAVRDQDHNATLHTIYRSFGDVRPAAEVIGMIGSAAG